MSAQVATSALLAVNVPVAKYVTVNVSGFSLNLDTIWSSLLAGVIVIGLGFLLRARLTSGVPGRLQLFWEAVAGWATEQAEQGIGPRSGPMIPLAITLFVFILVANWLEVLPSGAVEVAIPSPTADTNTVYAMAFFVFFVYNITGIKRRGFRFFKRLLNPINLIEELVKPFTLALRLFGNLFAGGLMIALLAVLFPYWLSWLPTVAWKLFDMFIGVIQAFIFALLSIIYYQAAVTEGH